MNKNARIQKLILYYCSGNKSKFAEKLGIKPQTLAGWETRNTLDYDLIFAKCENLSAKWLLTGEGEMFENAQKNNSEDTKTVSELLDRIERLVAENAVLKYQIKEKK
jgi:transcriptional regulator with XRE-family HTH domain